MQITLVALLYIPPEYGNLFAETYVGVENISYTYKLYCACVGLI